MQQVVLFGIRVGILGSFFFKVSNAMSMKNDRPNVSPGGNMT
jgi:hypothetical protein